MADSYIAFTLSLDWTETRSMSLGVSTLTLLYGNNSFRTGSSRDHTLRVISETLHSESLYEAQRPGSFSLAYVKMRLHEASVKSHWVIHNTFDALFR